MQYHIFTIGRNVGDKIDSIPTNAAIQFIDSELNAQYGIDSFSVYEGCGYWCGSRENTVRFEVFGLSDSNAKQLAATIAKQFSQDAVMLLSINSRPKFIRGDM